MLTWLRNRRQAKHLGPPVGGVGAAGGVCRSNKQARLEALSGQQVEVAWLENVLRESDPVGLVALGAPADEYRSEAETITLRRSEASLRDHVQRIVYEEFVYWFDEQIAGPPGNYSQIADVLWQRWNVIHEHVAKVVGPAPSTAELAAALWEEGAVVDSDGDPRYPWELTVALRLDKAQRVDIDGQQGSFETVIIRATTLELLDRSIAHLTSSGAIDC